MALTPASGGTLVAAQLLVQTLFDKSGTVYLYGTAKNDMGGQIAGFTQGATVACHIQPSKRFATETPEGGAETAVDRWAIAIPVGTSISVRDRFEIGSVFYEVLGHDIGKSFATEIMLDCIRIDDGGQ